MSLSAASCRHHWSGFNWHVAVHHIADPVVVHAQLGVDGGVSWVSAAVIEPLHALQLAIAHHHAATTTLERERGENRRLCSGCSWEMYAS